MFTGCYAFCVRNLKRSNMVAQEVFTLKHTNKYLKSEIQRTAYVTFYNLKTAYFQNRKKPEVVPFLIDSTSSNVNNVEALFLWRIIDWFLPNCSHERRQLISKYHCDSYLSAKDMFNHFVFTETISSEPHHKFKHLKLVTSYKAIYVGTNILQEKL